MLRDYINAQFVSEMLQIDKNTTFLPKFTTFLPKFTTFLPKIEKSLDLQNTLRIKANAGYFHAETLENKLVCV